MKEKTFEELIREYPTTAILSGRKVITDLDSLYDIMQQIREATIKECKESISYNWEQEIGLNYFEQRYNLNKLSNDRIKIKLNTKNSNIILPDNYEGIEG